MAWDLWSSTYDQVVHNSNYSEGRQCDFDFGCGRDVMEEDALNEKSCIQVLRNLIRKADTEIEELEKDLISLLNELALAEHQHWPDICCSALIEKINCLNVSITSLKNDNADNSGIQLPLHNEPAETLDEILKATQRDYCQDKCGQLVDVNVNILNPSMNVSKHQLDNESSNIDSNILTKEEQNEVCGTSENPACLKLPMELHEMGSDSPVKLKTANTNVKDSSPGSLKLAHSKEEKISAVYYSGGSEVAETEEHVFTAEDRLLIENVLMGPEEKRCNPKADKDLLAKTVVRSADLGAIICAPGPSDGLNLLETSDFKVLANEEVRRSQLVTADIGQMLKSFPSKGKGNIPKEAKQEDATVKDVTGDAFGLAAGIEGREKSLDSKLPASLQVKSENSDLDQKLCDFAPKTAQRDCKEESKVASTQGLDPINLPSNRDCKRTNPLQVDTTQELCLADREPWSSKNSLHAMSGQSASLVNAKTSVLGSTFFMQTKSALFTESQLADEGKSGAACLKSEITANLHKSTTSEPDKLNNQGKRKPESDPFSTREPGDDPIEAISNSSLKVTPRRQRKSRTSIDGTNSNESLNRKVYKRTLQPDQHETEEYAIVPYDSKFSELQKKRNVCKLSVTTGTQNSNVTMDLSNLDGLGMDNGNLEDRQTSWSCSSVNSLNEISALLPLSLKNLTLSNLRAIAKQHNVKKYYKLAKGPLMEQLAQKLSSC